MEKGVGYKPRHSCGGNLVDKAIAVNEDIFGVDSITIPYCTCCGDYIATGFCGKTDKAEFKELESAIKYIREIFEKRPRDGCL
jgi:hypothetical protein